MPGRGHAQARRRRDLPRGAAGNREGAVCMSTVIEKYADTDALVAAAGDRLVGAITDAIDAARRRATSCSPAAAPAIGLLKHVGEHGRRDRLVEGAPVLGRRALRARRRRRAQRQAGARGAAGPHRHPRRQRARDGPPATASSATTSTPPPLAYEQVLAANADEGAARHRISTSTCSAWAARDTSTRCSRDTAAVRETEPAGGRRDRLPQAAAAANHVDTARCSAVTRGVAGGVG